MLRSAKTDSRRMPRPTPWLLIGVPSLASMAVLLLIAGPATFAHGIGW